MTYSTPAERFKRAFTDPNARKRIEEKMQQVAEQTRLNRINAERSAADVTIAKRRK
jgi:hypothetical protein